MTPTGWLRGSLGWSCFSTDCMMFESLCPNGDKKAQEEEEDELEEEKLKKKMMKRRRRRGVGGGGEAEEGRG